MDSRHATITKTINNIMPDLFYPNHLANRFFTWIKNTNKQTKKTFSGDYQVNGVNMLQNRLPLQSLRKADI